MLYREHTCYIRVTFFPIGWCSGEISMCHSFIILGRHSRWICSHHVYDLRYNSLFWTHCHRISYSFCTTNSHLGFSQRMYRLYILPIYWDIRISVLLWMYFKEPLRNFTQVSEYEYNRGSASCLYLLFYGHLLWICLAQHSTEYHSKAWRNKHAVEASCKRWNRLSLRKSSSKE